MSIDRVRELVWVLDGPGRENIDEARIEFINLALAGFELRLVQARRVDIESDNWPVPMDDVVLDDTLYSVGKLADTAAELGYRRPEAVRVARVLIDIGTQDPEFSRLVFRRQGTLGPIIEPAISMGHLRQYLPMLEHKRPRRTGPGTFDLLREVVNKVLPPEEPSPGGSQAF